MNAAGAPPANGAAPSAPAGGLFNSMKKMLGFAGGRRRGAGRRSTRRNGRRNSRRNSRRNGRRN